jgi:dimethylargininase
MRRVTDSFSGCVTRRRPQPPLDPFLARRQQDGYRALLERGGFAVVMLPGDEAHPDGCFIEDTAVVAGGAALATRPGHRTRRGEVGPVARALGEHLPVTGMRAPARLDGGDVLQVRRRLFVGITRRSNGAGRRALARFAAPLGLEVVPVAVRGVLHLKSAVTALDHDTLLWFPEASDPGVFRGLRLVAVGGDDPEAANTVRLPDGRILVPAHLPQSAQAVRAAGFVPVPCEVSEFARADGGLSCLSVRLRGGVAPGEP